MHLGLHCHSEKQSATANSEDAFEDSFEDLALLSKLSESTHIHTCEHMGLWACMSGCISNAEAEAVSNQVRSCLLCKMKFAFPFNLLKTRRFPSKILS